MREGEGDESGEGVRISDLPTEEWESKKRGRMKKEEERRGEERREKSRKARPDQEKERGPGGIKYNSDLVIANVQWIRRPFGSRLVTGPEGLSATQ